MSMSEEVLQARAAQLSEQANRLRKRMEERKFGFGLVVVSAISALGVVVILFLGTSPAAAALVSAAHLAIAAFLADWGRRQDDLWPPDILRRKVVALACTALYALLLFYYLHSANLATVCLVLSLIGHACMYSGAHRLYSTGPYDEPLY